MDDAVVMTEDMKHRSDGKRNLLVVLEVGEIRRFQSAERHDMTMAVFGDFGKSRRAAGTEHHREVIGAGQRLRQAFGSFSHPGLDDLRSLAGNKNVRNA